MDNIVSLLICFVLGWILAELRDIYGMVKRMQEGARKKVMELEEVDADGCEEGDE